MKTYLDCYPCFMDQALRAGRIATEDEGKIKKVLDEVGGMLGDIPLESTPPETGRLIYRKIREITGIKDPYKQIKRQSTKTALSLYPSLKRRVQLSKDPLLTAVRLAIAGNVIDFGPNRHFDLEKEIDEALHRDFAINHYDAFKDRLGEAREVLYLGDNAGECVFDRILIEEIKKPVTFVVRGGAVINDVTHEDAVDAGMDKAATVFSAGTDAPGTVLETCSPEFMKIFHEAALILSKGQGNYEALSSEKRPVFFLLKAKCHIIAHDLGVCNGDIILKGSDA